MAGFQGCGFIRSEHFMIDKQYGRENRKCRKKLSTALDAQIFLTLRKSNGTNSTIKTCSTFRNTTEKKKNGIFSKFMRLMERQSWY